MNRKRGHPGEIIKRLMAERGPKSEAELARRAGIRQPTLNRIVSGESKDPENRTLERIAAYYRLSVSHLRGELPLPSGAQQPAADHNVHDGPEIRGKVPLISWVQAGDWSGSVDNFHPGHADEWVDTTVPIRQHTYALRVRGDSMTSTTGAEPTFPDGSIIIVEPDAVADPARMVNAFVIVKRTTDDEATFKQLVKDAGKFYLKPLNPRYPMLELKEDDVFCGVVREKPVRYF